MANIVIFQPTPWDNSKLFAWAYFGFSLLAAHTIVEFWSGINAPKYIAKKTLAVVLIIFLSTTGIFELIRLQRFDKNTYMLSKSEDIKFAQKVMINTKTDDIFLTASNHNYPLQMWGSRSIVLGYKGWVTNFGFDIDTRSMDIVNIFQYPKSSLNLIKKYKIDYVVISELEKTEFKVNQKFFDENYPVAFHDRNTSIYKVN